MRIPLAAPLTLFLLGGLLGLPAAYDPMLSAPWLLWLAVGALLYIGLVWLGGAAGRLHLAAALPVLVAAGGALLLIVQYRHLGFDPKFAALARLGLWLSLPAPALPLPHIDPNAAAAFLAGALPFALGLALDARGPARVAWLGCAGLVALAVLLTASRGAWAALAAVALLAGLAWAAGALPLRRAVPIAMAVALLGLLLGWLVLARFPAAADALVLRATDRLTVYRNDLFLVLDLPFTGIGPGATFGEVYARLQLLIQVPFIGYAHNLLLGAWLAQGLLGLIGLLGLVLQATVLILPRLRAGAGPLAWGTALGAATPLLHGLTDAPQYDTAWTALLMAFALLAVAVAEPRTKNQALDSERTPTTHRMQSMLLCYPLRRICRAVACVRPTPTMHHAALAILALAVGLSLFARPVGAVGCANAAALLRIWAELRPGLNESARAELRTRAIVWAERGLWLEAGSVAALKQRAMLAFDAQEFGRAAELLAPAFAQRPSDQSLRKALGYALLWTGRVEQATNLLAGLTYADEIREELTVWPLAWRERGREDLARLAERAATQMR